MTITFKYEIGDEISMPLMAYGKKNATEKYKVVGYDINQQGEFYELLPLTFQSKSIKWRKAEIEK